MKIIDIIIKMHKKEKLPKEIEYVGKKFIFKFGGYYTTIGDSIFNYISENMLDAEVKILRR